MLFKDFIKLVSSRMKRVTTAKIIFESEETASALNKLLEKYENNANEIESVDELIPFYEFLKKRWIKIAGTKFAYSIDREHTYSTCKTKANAYCHILADCLNTAVNLVTHTLKNRDSKEILMPAIDMDFFAREMLGYLDEISKEQSRHANLFIYLETEITIEDFRQLLLPYINSQELTSIDTLKPFIAWLALRWDRVHHSETSYQKNPNSLANKVCQKLAEYICTAANANTITYNNDDPDSLLMPRAYAYQDEESANQRYREALFLDLKKRNEIKLLQKIKFTMGDFAKELLSIREKFSEETNKNLFVNKESQLALKKWQHLVSTYLNSNEEMTESIWNIFVDFFRNRWGHLEGNEASYLANPDANANKLYTTTAYYLCILSCKFYFFVYDPAIILMPIQSLSHSLEAAEMRLKQAVYQELTNRDALIREMLPDKNSCKLYLSGMTKENLIFLLTNGKHSMEDLLEIKDLFTSSEIYDRILLFALFEVYLKDLDTYSKEPEGLQEEVTPPVYKTNLAYVMTYFTIVYSISQKRAAAKALQEFILSPESLAHYPILLDQPGSILYKHKGPLDEGLLKRFVSFVFRVIALQAINVDKNYETQGMTLLIKN